jgi:hypothetical protein
MSLLRGSECTVASMQSVTQVERMAVGRMIYVAKFVDVTERMDNDWLRSETGSRNEEE